MWRDSTMRSWQHSLWWGEETAEHGRTCSTRAKSPWRCWEDTKIFWGFALLFSLNVEGVVLLFLWLVFLSFFENFIWAAPWPAGHSWDGSSGCLPTACCRQISCYCRGERLCRLWLETQLLWVSFHSLAAPDTEELAELFWLLLAMLGWQVFKYQTSHCCLNSCRDQGGDNRGHFPVTSSPTAVIYRIFITFTAPLQDWLRIPCALQGPSNLCPCRVPCALKDHLLHLRYCCRGQLIFSSKQPQTSQPIVPWLCGVIRCR